MLITDEQLFLSQSYSDLYEHAMPKGKMKTNDEVALFTKISRTLGNQTIMVKAKAL